MKRPKDKGTRAETALVRRMIVDHGLDAWRSSANTPSCDVICGDWAIEVKKRNRLDIRGWVNSMRLWHGATKWALVVFDGDKRKTEAMGDIMILDLTTALELIEHWERR